MRVRKRPRSTGWSYARNGLISRGAEAPKAYGRRQCDVDWSRRRTVDLRRSGSKGF